MVTHPKASRIPIASADEIAARLPFPSRREGRGYRTRGLCHGSGDKPSSASLVYENPKRVGEQSLHVHCYKCNPHTLTEKDAIRHALQRATGLWVCRCDACFTAFRAGQPPPGANATPAPVTHRPRTQPNRTPKPPKAGRTTADYAADLWAAAQPSSTGPAPQHPAAKWLAERSLWPTAEPLPEAVRWLARDHRTFPRGQPDSAAAGALVMAMRPLDNPTAPPRKVQLVAIDRAGHKAHHWPDKTDKHTYGTGPTYGLLWRGQLRTAAYDLHICEGLADGLRILRYADEPALVAVCAGTGYGRILPGYFDSITLWPDADEAGAKSANAAAQRWANQGYNVTIKRLPASHDPASAPLRK